VGAAKIERHHIVLDLNAGTGLLTWEAVRQTPEGSVWALAENEKAASGMHAQALDLSEMDRPVIMAGPLEKIQELVSGKGQGEVRFDVVLGRNALLSVHDKAAALKAVSQVLAPEGTISIVEGVSRHGQRIYDLVDQSGLDRNLIKKWIAAEETIYEDSSDAMVNWTRDDLHRAFEQAGLIIRYFHSEQITMEILVTEAVLSRWFPEADGVSGKPARPSYRDRLAASLSPREVDQIRRYVTEKLAGKQIGWVSESIYVVAQRKENTSEPIAFLNG